MNSICPPHPPRSGTAGWLTTGAPESCALKPERNGFNQVHQAIYLISRTGSEQSARIRCCLLWKTIVHFLQAPQGVRFFFGGRVHQISNEFDMSTKKCLEILLAFVQRKFYFFIECWGCGNTGTTCESWGIHVHAVVWPRPFGLFKKIPTLRSTPLLSGLDRPIREDILSQYQCQLCFSGPFLIDWIAVFPFKWPRTFGPRVSQIRSDRFLLCFTCISLQTVCLFLRDSTQNFVGLCGQKRITDAPITAKPSALLYCWPQQFQFWGTWMEVSVWSPLRSLRILINQLPFSKQTKLDLYSCLQQFLSS